MTPEEMQAALTKAQAERAEAMEKLAELGRSSLDSKRKLDELTGRLDSANGEWGKVQERHQTQTAELQAALEAAKQELAKRDRRDAERAADAKRSEVAALAAGRFGGKVQPAAIEGLLMLQERRGRYKLPDALDDAAAEAAVKAVMDTGLPIDTQNAQHGPPDRQQPKNSGSGMTREDVRAMAAKMAGRKE